MIKVIYKLDINLGYFSSTEIAFDNKKNFTQIL